MKLTRYEMETIITYNADEKIAEIYTADLSKMNRLDKLCSDFPNIYKLKKFDEISKTYIVPKEYITFRKPRVLSERQLENLKKRNNK